MTPPFSQKRDGAKSFAPSLPALKRLAGRKKNPRRLAFFPTPKQVILPITKREREFVFIIIG
jgi:hypothetical protein